MRTRNKNRISVNLDPFIEGITETPHIIIGNYTDEDGIAQSVTLLSNDMFKEYLDSLLYDRIFPVKLLEGEELETGVIRTFNNRWNVFLAENDHNFDRIAEALYTYYNPLYNYNKKLNSENVKSGSEADSLTKIYGATSNTLTKSGSDVLQNVFGAKSDTLSKSGQDVTTNVYGAKEKNTAESGSYTDTHNIGQKQTTSEVTTMDNSSYNPTGRVTEAARVDSDVKTYNNHNVEETEETYTDTETHSFNNYQESNASTSHTDTATHSFNNYQETAAGIQHTDTDSGNHVYNNVKDVYSETMYGNIGVMESVTMIESELRLRRKQIGFELLFEFMDLYTYRV